MEVIGGPYIRGKTAIMEGNGAPSSLLGNNGDFYLDIAGQALYKKTGGAWTVAISTVPTFPANPNVFLNGNGAFSLVGGAALATKFNEATIVLANGNFTPNESGDFLIIASGGGGGGGGGKAVGAATASYGGGGGGGSGGAIGFSIVTLVALTPYACIIGTGGAGGSTQADGVDGTATQFNAVVIAAGGKAGRGDSLLTGALGNETSENGFNGGGNGGGQGGGGVGAQTAGQAGGNAVANTGGGGGGGSGAANAAGTTANNGGGGGNGGSGWMIIMRA